MKILFVSTGISYGGAYKIFVWLANMLSKAGHEITLLTYRSDKQISYQSIDPAIHRLYSPTESHGKSLLGCLRTARMLRRLIHREGYDFGIAFLPPAQIRLSLACLMSRKTKVMLSQRGDPLHERWLLPSDAYVFQTEYAKSHYPYWIRKKSAIIPNPVIPLARTKPRIPEKRIVNLARWEFQIKRQDVLVQAFNQISERYPDYTLELYGSGRDAESLSKMAAKNPRIKLMKTSEDVQEVMQNAAMFVLSSDHEGIPNALLEAMSLGVPCISTDYSPGGVDSLIQDGVSGLIVPRGDVNALSIAMERFISDADLAESCGAAGCGIVSSFSEERIARMWLDYIEGVVQP